ncbi:MAG TPA: calcium-binding protein, partial [Pirellulaceae bacterium]|nr:calcium-binding protein [Pirellulaceae bacterium]
EGLDTLSGGKGFDSLWGGIGNDTLRGGDDDDLLHGDEGDDSVQGDAGIDILHGDDGNDDLRGGADDDKAYGDAGNDVLYDVEGSQLLDGGDGDDSLTAGLGNDTLLGGLGNDRLDAGNGDNMLGGGDGNDTLYAGVGADFLMGDAGDDYMSPGDGTNTVLGGAGNDSIYGGLGSDYLFGEVGDDLIASSGGNDSVDGGVGNDSIYGGTGDDIVLGGDGNDTIFAGEGLDSIDGQIGNDFIFGEGGDDTLHGGLGDDSLNGGYGNDSLYGDAGRDVLDATAGDDWLDGGADVDRLFGGDGNDTLDGGTDSDVLTGGEGDDTVYYTNDWGIDAPIVDAPETTTLDFGGVTFALNGRVYDSGWGVAPQTYFAQIGGVVSRVDLPMQFPRILLGRGNDDVTLRLDAGRTLWIGDPAGADDYDLQVSVASGVNTLVTFDDRSGMGDRLFWNRDSSGTPFEFGFDEVRNRGTTVRWNSYPGFGMDLVQITDLNAATELTTVGAQWDVGDAVIQVVTQNLTVTDAMLGRGFVFDATEDITVKSPLTTYASGQISLTAGDDLEIKSDLDIPTGWGTIALEAGGKIDTNSIDLIAPEGELLIHGFLRRSLNTEVRYLSAVMTDGSPLTVYEKDSLTIRGDGLDGGSGDVYLSMTDFDVVSDVGSVRGSGRLTLRNNKSGGATYIGSATGVGMNLSEIDLAGLADGFSNIQILGLSRSLLDQITVGDLYSDAAKFRDTVEMTAKDIVFTGHLESTAFVGTIADSVRVSSAALIHAPRIGLTADHRVTIDGTVSGDERVTVDVTVGASSDLSLFVSSTGVVETTGAGSTLAIETKGGVQVDSSLIGGVPAQGRISANAANATLKVKARGEVDVEGRIESNGNATTMELTADLDVLIAGLVSADGNGSSLTLDTDGTLTVYEGGSLAGGDGLVTALSKIDLFGAVSGDDLQTSTDGRLTVYPTGTVTVESWSATALDDVVIDGAVKATSGATVDAGQAIEVRGSVKASASSAIVALTAHTSFKLFDAAQISASGANSLVDIEAET